MRHLLPSLLLVLAACNQSARPLYYDGDPPTISGIGGESSTLGNLGGAEIALQGSGFGDDPTAVVVQFGSQNAEIVAVSDTELTLIVPNGPIEGGAVDVKVATEGGVALAEGLYTYEVGTLYEGEASYVHVNDYYYSCYGGAAADSAGVGCQDIVYLGNTGLTGTAAFYDFIFPRVHTPNIGFYSGTDLSPGVWGVTAPAYTLFTSGVSELRQNVPNFTLVNPVIEGEEWCADLSSLASWTWNGTDTLDPVTLRAGGDLLSEAEDCTVSTTRASSSSVRSPSTKRTTPTTTRPTGPSARRSLCPPVKAATCPGPPATAVTAATTTATARSTVTIPSATPRCGLTPRAPASTASSWSCPSP